MPHPSGKAPENYIIRRLGGLIPMQAAEQQHLVRASDHGNSPGDSLRYNPLGGMDCSQGNFGTHLPPAWVGLTSQYGASVSSISLSTGMPVTTWRFSSVFREHPLMPDGQGMGEGEYYVKEVPPNLMTTLRVHSHCFSAWACAALERQIFNKNVTLHKNRT